MARDIVDDRLIGALHVRALSRAGLQHDTVDEHVAVQAGTLAALLEGGYDGDATLAEILRLGDLGLGTVQHLDGELVVLDGAAWAIRSDGRVDALDGSVRTPFAVVCRFRGETSLHCNGPWTLAELRDRIEGVATGEIPGLDDEIVAVRASGRFADLRLRSVARQHHPYPPLRDVVAHQTEWQVDSAVGTIVGFRFPDTLAGLEVPGYHVHFLSDDRTAGGHVIDLTMLDGDVQLQRCDDLHVELPAGVALGSPGAVDRDEVRQVEGGGASTPPA
jgi:acetolactate decarboxylase